MSVVNANSVDPDQTPRSTASDLVYTLANIPFTGKNGLTIEYLVQKLYQEVADTFGQEYELEFK